MYEALNGGVALMALASGTYAGMVAFRNAAYLPWYVGVMLVFLMLACYFLAGLNFYMVFRG